MYYLKHPLVHLVKIFAGDFYELQKNRIIDNYAITLITAENAVTPFQPCSVNVLIRIFLVHSFGETFDVDLADIGIVDCATERSGTEND